MRLTALCQHRKPAVGLFQVVAQLFWRHMPADAKVLLDGQFGEDASPFEHLLDSQCRDLAGGHVIDGLSVELHRALGDFTVMHVEQAGHRAQQRGLARSIGAEQRDDLAFRHSQADSAEHLDHVVVDDLQIVHRQNRGSSTHTGMHNGSPLLEPVANDDFTLIWARG